MIVLTGNPLKSQKLLTAKIAKNGREVRKEHPSVLFLVVSFTA
jgi:hypothetical protein